MFKSCADAMLRCCVLEVEIHSIIKQCHDLPCGGHAAASKTSSKILQCGFYWPTLFRNVQVYVKTCDHCQRVGNLPKANAMPMALILAVDIFHMWGIDFQDPYPSSFGNKYILVAVDYVSKWVETIATKTNDAQVVTKFFKKVIFPRFGCHHVVISDNGTHFIKHKFESLLRKYGVLHRFALLYQPKLVVKLRCQIENLKSFFRKLYINPERTSLKSLMTPFGLIGRLLIPL